MQRKSALPVVVLILLGFFAVWCFSSIIGRRFSAGEVYPRYSTLRSDPLGARALFDSIDGLEGTGALRNYRSLDKLDGGPGQTLMLLHLTPELLASTAKINGKDIQAFAARGGRVVITLDGQLGNWEDMEKRVDKRRDENAKREARKRMEERKKAREKKAVEEKQSEGKKKDRKTEADDDEPAPLRKAKPLDEVLGLTIEQRNFVMTAKGAVKLGKSPALPLKDEDLPAWYSRTVIKFEEEPEKDPEEVEEETGKKDKKTVSTADRWTALAAHNDEVMLAEQRIGQGTVVVATDSYFASNEALLKEPAPEFLAWLVGPAREVVFDETHLGTVESPGIMTLARRLHLQGLFIGGLVLFGLFIWQSSSSLVPAEEASQREADAVVSGHGATAGLVSLLRRGIPRSQLLTKCFEVWVKSARQTGAAHSRVVAAEQIMAPVKRIRVAGRQVPAIYQLICQAVHTSPRKPQNKA